MNKTSNNFQKIPKKKLIKKSNSTRRTRKEARKLKQINLQET